MQLFVVAVASIVVFSQVVIGVIAVARFVI
jgi:hypothetical protein